MTKREKIIIGLVAAAAVGGGFQMVLPPGDGSRENHREKADFSSVVTTVQVGLQQEQLTPREQYSLTAAATEWLHDPLRPGPLVLRNEEAGEELPLPVYTGFINTGPRPIAIIEGRDYRPNEPVAGGEFQVIGIFPDRVELLRRGSSAAVAVPISKQGHQ